FVDWGVGLFKGSAVCLPFPPIRDGCSAWMNLPPYQNRRAMPSEARQDIKCRLRLRHSRESENLELLNLQTAFEYCRCPTFWIPACAGMTG
ncbi:TPA: hypothetical protein ACFNM0_002088, partial [Neisseria lactamica]